MSVGRFLQQAAAGNAGEAVYVDDVFSTYLFDGTGSAQTITNGIDVDGEGGMVWIKRRDVSSNHLVWDTERGNDVKLSTDLTSAEASGWSPYFSFTSSGFNVDAFASGSPYASWTFRKQPGFFDVVTWTGDGVSGRAISHSLGSAPGMIIIKRTSASDNWVVWHRSLSNPQTKYLLLNSTVAEQNQSTPVGQFGGQDPTSTEFYVGPQTEVNSNGQTYVAYLFAHDAQEFGTGSDESIIKCGSYTGTGSAGNTIDVGFEPQWIMFKRTNSSSDWVIFDSMRGLTTSGNNGDRYLYPNQSTAEGGLEQIALTPTGFVTEGSWGEVNANGGNYIYVAIRRPHKPAEEFAATDLFAIDTRNSTGDGQEPGFRSGFPVDMNLFRTNITQSNAARVSSRLTGTKYLESSSTNAELTGSTTLFDYMNGWLASGGTSADAYSWMFRRAPGFFDVVAYTGDGSGAKSFKHNLGVIPELMIVKGRNYTDSWYVYVGSLGASNRLKLQSTTASGSAGTLWNSTSPTATQFTVGSGLNASAETNIVYLFATVPGISKVGSYSGTGSNLTIDCGFASGARFVLIKSTTFAGGWFLWDSARGITTGNDYHLKLDVTNAQTTDSVVDIEPDSSGFIVNGPNANINSSGNEYIFLAIA